MQKVPESNLSAGAQPIRVCTAAEAGVSDSDICAFYAANWTRPIALSRPDFSHWQFCQAPDADGENHSVVALAGETLLAVMGVTPRQFLNLDRMVSGADLTTWVVAEAARGKGIGHRILEFLQARYDVLMGAGITGAALPLYLRAGFTHLAHIPRFFWVADFESISRFAAAEGPALDLVRARQKMRRPVAYEAQPCEAAALGSLSETIDDTHTGAGRRDVQYLRWRFDQHPVFQHQAFKINDPSSGCAGAGVVLRQDQVSETPILHLLDLVADQRDVPAALNFVEDYAAEIGAAFVDVSLTSGAMIGQVRARGWNASVDDPLIELPSLFYPVELRRPPTTSVVVWTAYHRESFYNLNRLHITKSDLDLDRPTLAYYAEHGL